MKSKSKDEKVMFFLKIALALDLLSTYTFLTYSNLKEENLLIVILYNIHPLLIFIYIPVIVLLCRGFLNYINKIGFNIEGRAVILMIDLIFLWAAVSNVISMIVM